MRTMAMSEQGRQTINCDTKLSRAKHMTDLPYGRLVELLAHMWPVAKIMALGHNAALMSTMHDH